LWMITLANSSHNSFAVLRNHRIQACHW
jgi:hypothetical protein